jgi:hypothetical protein
MSMKHRLGRLEGIHRSEEPSFTFTIAAPPDGLTEAEQAQWREEYERDCDVRGISWFTLDLSSGGAGLREVEP